MIKFIVDHWLLILLCFYFAMSIITYGFVFADELAYQKKTNTCFDIETYIMLIIISLCWPFSLWRIYITNKFWYGWKLWDTLKDDPKVLPGGWGGKF